VAIWSGISTQSTPGRPSGPISHCVFCDHGARPCARKKIQFKRGRPARQCGDAGYIVLDK